MSETQDTHVPATPASSPDARLAVSSAASSASSPVVTPGRRARAGLTALLLAGTGIGAGVLIARVLPAADTASLSLQTVAAAPTSVTALCPPGVVNSFAPASQAAPPAVWSSAPRDVHTGTVTTILTQAQDGAIQLPSSVVIAAQGGGELRGMSLTPCRMASTDQWFAAGSTTLGEDLVLALSNSGTIPSVVTVSALGAGGKVAEPQQITVPAGQTIFALPAGWFTDESRLALHVEADGPGVAAWLQSTRMDGETPRGNAWVPSTTPATRTLIPALPSTHSTLRIAVPGTDSAHVEVEQISASGTHPLPGGQFDVDGQAVLDIPLDDLGEAISSMRITSSHPVVAQVMTRQEGADYPTGGRWDARSFLNASTPLTSIGLPGTGDLTERITAQMNAPLVRATSVETARVLPETALNPRMSLVLSADDPTRDVLVKVGESEHTIPAGTQVVIDLPAAAQVLTSNAPIHGALRVQVDTPTGAVEGTWVLGTLGMSRHDMLVDARS